MAPDRISNLPCHILDHILKYLPLRDAVRTSILSRGWRYEWLTVPHLVFDWSCRQQLNGECSLESIIYQVLLLHKGPIFKFSLEPDCVMSSVAIDCWLRFLSNHHIEDFTLRLHDLDLDYNYVLPHHFFKFEHLRHLTLQNVVLETPPAFKGFSRLVKLELSEICSDLEDIERFISKCPRVESLDIHDCNDTPWNLDIDAPNLKSFKFYGILCSIFFKNASLEEIAIRYCDLDLDIKVVGDGSNLIKVFGHQPSIIKLEFNYQFLAMGGPPQKPEHLTNLARLQLSDVELECLDVATGAIYAIRSSPNLQHLEIGCDACIHEEERAAVEYLKAQQEHKVSLEHLKTVKIHCLSGYESEMEFVKLILLWATVLRTLEVTYWKDDGVKKERSALLEEMASFSRASSKAVLIFD